MCKKIDSEILGRGYGCCGTNCNTYNADSRDTCKFCNKERCAESRFEDKEVAYEKDGKIVIARIKPQSSDKLN